MYTKTWRYSLSKLRGKISNSSEILLQIQCLLWMCVQLQHTHCSRSMAPLKTYLADMISTGANYTNRLWQNVWYQTTSYNLGADGRSRAFMCFLLLSSLTVFSETKHTVLSHGQGRLSSNFMQPKRSRGTVLVFEESLSLLGWMCLSIQVTTKNTYDNYEFTTVSSNVQVVEILSMKTMVKNILTDYFPQQKA